MERLTGQIEGGIGRAEILMPKDVGVRLRIEGGLGSIDAPDFIRNGEGVPKRGVGKTSAGIDLAIEAGSAGSTCGSIGSGYTISFFRSCLFDR